MSKYKYKCWNVNCEKYGEVQQFEAEQKECPFCHENNVKDWEKLNSKKKLPWVIVIGMLLAAIVAYIVWPCEHTLNLSGSRDRIVKVGSTDTLRAIIHEGDSVIWEVTEGEEHVGVVGINDSTGVMTAKKEGLRAIVVASLYEKPDVKDTCIYKVNPAEIVSPDTVGINKDSISNDTPKNVDSGKDLSIKEKKEDTPEPPKPPIVKLKTGTIDLGYATYYGPINTSSQPHGLGGELKFKRNYEIDLKKASGERVAVKAGDIMRNCKFDNGRLVQGLIIFSNGEQRWITIGS